MRSEEILKTVEMIQKENLDVRAVTMGISLLDCHRADAKQTCDAIIEKITRHAGKLVQTCEQISSEYAVPVVNKRISVTPIAHVGAGFDAAGFIQIAQALDEAASLVGIDILGGYSADVANGVTSGDTELINSIPEALSTTHKICSSVNVGSTRAGINMDAVAHGLGMSSRNYQSEAQIPVVLRQPNLWCSPTNRVIILSWLAQSMGWINTKW